MTGNFSDQKMFKKENCIYFLNNKLIKIFLTCFPGNNIKLLLNLIFFFKSAKLCYSNMDQGKEGGWDGSYF